VITDQSGGQAVIGVENTVIEGRGWLWHGVLRADSLRKLPFGAFQVIAPRRSR
jgi:hypothetical protein